MPITKYMVHDHETYYDKEYTLRKMTPVQYILDNRFEHIGCAVLENDDGKPQWMNTDVFKEHINELRERRKRGEKITIVTHNALFDMCLLAWRFHFVPDLCVDTMSMSRALLYHKIGYASLAKVAEHMHLPAKGTAITYAAGKTGEMLRENKNLWKDYVEYAEHDALLCQRIFKRLRNQMPPSEYVVNDMVIRMAVLPQFRLDADALSQHLGQILADKQTLLERCGLYDREALMSNDKFAELLRERGVDPPVKLSMTTGQQIYAFAKTDAGMAELEEHDDPDVQALVAARLGHKSTLEETRTQRFLDISALEWPRGWGKALMPIPLRYSGAHTHRFSGDWKLNCQNLGRNSVLRKALVAPRGRVVLACDASQIEARLTAYVCGQDDLVEDFRQAKDIYSQFAGEEVYNRPIDKNVDKKERFVGKTCILGLGYGMGSPKFRDTVRAQSRIQLKQELLLEETEATRIVRAYRRRFGHIAAGWKTLQGLLPALANDGVAEFGPVRIESGTVLLPNGMRLYYRDLASTPGDKGPQWTFRYGRDLKYIYGGKLLENIVQALARIVVMNAALRMRKRYPRLPLALQVHDELVYVVREEEVDEVSAALMECMCAPVPWAPGLPVAAEAAYGASYGDAK